uniref:Uncharacterized protein n=1 Tax=Anguilla anguilla TaxID=7936 RepID=A0A0E9TFM8_ANGAN
MCVGEMQLCWLFLVERQRCDLNLTHSSHDISLGVFHCNRTVPLTPACYH